MCKVTKTKAEVNVMTCYSQVEEVEPDDYIKTITFKSNTNQSELLNGTPCNSCCANLAPFTLLVVLMSLSLIGIIFVQAYYINNSLETKEEQFTFNVKKALNYTANQVATVEYKK